MKRAPDWPKFRGASLRIGPMFILVDITAKRCFSLTWDPDGLFRQKWRVKSSRRDLSFGYALGSNGAHRGARMSNIQRTSNTVGQPRRLLTNIDDVRPTSAKTKIVPSVLNYPKWLRLETHLKQRKTICLDKTSGREMDMAFWPKIYLGCFLHRIDVVWDDSRVI